MVEPVPSDGDVKATWRAWARAVERRAHSDAVVAALGAWQPLHGVVATYVAMDDEVDLASLADRPDIRPLVPRTEADGSLTFHDLVDADLVRHAHGFLEPAPESTPVLLDDLDVILVPGLAFDRRGARLGRGGGFYDRLLADLPVGVIRIGVTVSEAFVPALPTEPHDRGVDWIATEHGVTASDRSLPTSTLRMIDAAIPTGIAPAMVRFPEGTKTSLDAARAVDAELGSIAKSIVFLVDDDPVLVLCSGDRRIDSGRLAEHFGAATARPAPLDRVREVTGYVAGGTPAVGHTQEIEVVADPSLCRYRWVWSAGGTPDTVYPVALDRLVASSGARWVDVAERG